MTIFIPLDAASPLPPSPHFLVPSTQPTTHVQKVVKAILKAKRIAVLCGAGISVKAGIPDFRSETGLFQSLKKDHTSLTSGKDLFDASVFNSESTTALFCRMIAGLAELAQIAQPTPFHRMLRALDDRGRLLRVYTQNIDALELKAGLTFGVPELDVKRNKPRSSKGVSESETAAPGPSTDIASRLPTPPAETPRCIPLHGTLQSMHCQICLHSFPLDQHLGSLSSGMFPICPDCSETEETRQAVGKRSRGVGKLRPSVVLYNEMHKDGEEVGGVVARDLVGSSKGKGRTGADLLIVVGTSLRVPGTKRMVREFSKAIHSRNSAYSATQGESSTSGPSSSAEDDHPITTIYLNLDFPVPTREWEGVFDVWLRGDAQSFARLVQEEMEREEQTRVAALERKRRRDEMKAEAEAAREEEERQLMEARLKARNKGKTKGKVQNKASSVVALSKKRKAGVEQHSKKTLTTKRRKVSSAALGTTARKAFHGHSKAPPSPRKEKVIIKLPARHHLAYTPLTPPPSQSQRSRAGSPTRLHEGSYFSSPLSTPPMSGVTTPGEPHSGYSSPLTQLSSSPSLELSSPLSILLSPSPALEIAASLQSHRRPPSVAQNWSIHDYQSSRSPSPSVFNMTSQLSSPPPTPPQMSLGVAPSISRRRTTVLPLFSDEHGNPTNLIGRVQHVESYVRASATDISRQ
ncbi:DHS-like NAD/FAD-binding domain-containing protein [Cytidiella melzeri]|nr:DHS-like NAD/FAD-binding domain-containing protein [Cytidiella melzeri]